MTKKYDIVNIYAQVISEQARRDLGYTMTESKEDQKVTDKVTADNGGEEVMHIHSHGTHHAYYNGGGDTDDGTTHVIHDTATGKFHGFKIPAGKKAEAQIHTMHKKKIPNIDPSVSKAVAADHNENY